jgi:putative nucleotidyltransferase with HDIG domain
MSEEDRLFAYQHLNIKEAALFFSLPEFEQKHGVVVAQKMLKMVKGAKNMKLKKLARLGLLHDIGKSSARLSIIDKSVLVVLHRFIRPLYDLLASFGKNEKSFKYFKKFYVHKHHGEIGAEILSKIAEEKDIVEEIRSHDFPYPAHDIYMKLLDRADSTY